MAYHKIEFPCGVPELSWWEGINIPEFKHIKNLQLKILDVIVMLVYQEEANFVVNKSK